MAIGVILQKLENITDEQLGRIDNLVPRTLIGTLQPKPKFEVLGFYTQAEWEMMQDEVNMKKKVFATFRSYDDAENYAQRLATGPTFMYKVVMRA